MCVQVGVYEKCVFNTGWPPKKEHSIFLGLCSDQQLSFYTLLDRTSFPHYNNTKIIKFGWKLFILWVISYGLSFSGFVINFSLVGGPPRNGTVNFLGLCSDEQLFFSPCWIEHLFVIIMTPRSSNLVENFLFYEVISYRLSFLAHPVRRTRWAYAMAWRPSSVRPSVRGVASVVRPSVRPQFSKCFFFVISQPILILIVS